VKTIESLWKAMDDPVYVKEDKRSYERPDLIAFYDRTRLSPLFQPIADPRDLPTNTNLQEQIRQHVYKQLQGPAPVNTINSK